MIELLELLKESLRDLSAASGNLHRAGFDTKEVDHGLQKVENAYRTGVRMLNLDVRKKENLVALDAYSDFFAKSIWEDVYGS